MRKRKYFVFKFLIFLILLAVLFGCGCFLFIFSNDDFVEFDKEKLLREEKSKLVVLDKDGNILDENKSMSFVDVDTLSKETIYAFLATEDKRFYEHKGIDVKRIIGAFLKNIKSGKIKEGASTITQQLAKNIFLSSEKTVNRKLNEIILAKNIEKNFSKNEILKIYLDTVYFGSGAYGLQNASKTFFGVDANKLTLAQSAGLAGVLKAPTTYSPIYNFDKFEKRKNLILKIMHKDGIIDEKSYLDAVNEEIIVKEKVIDYSQDYFDMVLAQACDVLKVNKKLLISKDYIIKTYFDDDVQASLKYSIAQNNTLTENNHVTNKCGVIMDNFTKGIKGFYGASKSELWNKRINPGSVFKPIAVFAPALEKGVISPITPVLDEKVEFGNFKPSNYKNIYYGWTSIRNSIKNSLNIPAIKVLNAMGVDSSIQYLNKNGIDLSAKDKNLTLALGNIDGGCGIFQLLNSYSTFGGGGNFGEFSFIKEIIYNNKVIYKHSTFREKVFSEETVFLISDMLKDVVESGTGKVLKNLKFDLAGKTGTFGVKNSGNFDVAFCGYTKDVTCLFWVGASDYNDLLPNHITGGGPPAIMAKDFFSKYQELVNYNPGKFIIPKGIKEFKIDKNMLEREQKISVANNDSNEYVSEYFNILNPPTKSHSIFDDNKKLIFDVVRINKSIKLKSNIKDTAFYIVKQKGEKLLGIGNEITINNTKGTNKVITIVARVYYGGKIFCERKNIYLS